MTNEEAFEKWFCGDDYRETLLEKDKNGHYKYQQAYFAHTAWQAAIAYMQEKSEPAKQSEPVATIYNGIAYWIGKEPPEGTNLFTTPQRQQPLKRLDDKKLEEMIYEHTSFNVNVHEDTKTVKHIKNLANTIMDEMERINK